jgi:ferritin-like metal-binding protein YciE
MKNKISSIEDAFVYNLHQLFYTESRIKEGLFDAEISMATSILKPELMEYADSSYSKLLKLERIFNYLMREPNSLRYSPIVHMLEETAEALQNTSGRNLKDIIIVSAFRSINAIKISNYRNAYIYSVELELDTPSDLLQEILGWEVLSGKMLARIAIEEFNSFALPKHSGQI